jgi:hypothetical protein
VSLGNYIAKVSGQETNPTLNSDCIDATSLSNPQVLGQFADIAPGTDADAAASTSACPGPGTGSGRSTTSSTSVPPARFITIAFIAAPKY